MRKTIIAAGMAISLAGCAASTAPPPGLTGDVQQAVTTTADAVASIGSASSSLLTKAADAACSGQALANLATDFFTAIGKPGAAAKSATVSAKLGSGCSWGKLL